MTACLNIAAFLGLSAALACKYRERLVTVVPITTAALILVLFVLALFRALYLIDVVAGLTLIACAVFFILAFGRNGGRELLKALISPSKLRRSVVLPIPFAPTKATFCPRSKRKLSGLESGSS